MNGRQVRIQERKDHIAGLENAGRTFCTWWQMKIQVTCDFIVYKKLSYRRGTTRRSTAAQCTALLKKIIFQRLAVGNDVDDMTSELLLFDRPIGLY